MTWDNSHTDREKKENLFAFCLIRTERERERERAERNNSQLFSCLKGQREQIQSQQSQLLSEIMQLETNPTNPEQQVLLESKKNNYKS